MCRRLAERLVHAGPGAKPCVVGEFRENGEVVSTKCFADDGVTEKRTTALLDQHNLLKNPNLIVNDSVKLACDNLWTTLKERVILRYGLTSEQMKFIITWINTNLQQLPQIVE